MSSSQDRWHNSGISSGAHNNGCQTLSVLASKHVLTPGIHPEVDRGDWEHVRQEEVQILGTQVLQSSIVVRTEAASLESLQPPGLHLSIPQVLHHPLDSQRACFTCWSMGTMLSTGVLIKKHKGRVYNQMSSYCNVVTEMAPCHRIHLTSNGSPEVRNERGTVGIIGGVDTQSLLKQLYLISSVATIGCIFKLMSNLTLW